MANEISNISHAGLVVAFPDDPDTEAPILSASWGIDEVAGFTRQEAAGVGLWTIPLSRTIGALTGPIAGQVLEIGGVVTSAKFLTGGGGFDVGLIATAQLGGASLPVNTAVQLDLLLFQLFDEVGAPADIVMGCNVIVSRVPQQD